MRRLQDYKPIAIDLFCGAGGLTRGLKDAGFKVLAGVEINPVAARTYKANHPRVKLYENDIKDIHGERITNDLNIQVGELDLLAGCPPCQGFSSHRTRNRPPAKSDIRNDLIFEFLRITEQLLPKTIMLENVPALAKDWRVEVVRNRLRELGYIIDGEFCQIKNAADYGVPQRRKRLLIKASRFGVIFNPANHTRQRTVRDALKGLAQYGISGDPLHDIPELRSDKVRKIIASIPKNGGSRSDLPKHLWLDCHKRNEGSYKDVYGRMQWDSIAPTITGGCHNPSKGRFLHPVEDRAITLREAALLQTFPKSYRFFVEDGKEAIALMIGNALPPKFIKAHAIEYIKHLGSIKNES